MKKSKQTNLKPAIDHFGSVRGIAEAMDINPMAVRQWRKRGIPALRAIELSELSSGAFKASDILPILKGHVV